MGITNVNRYKNSVFAGYSHTERAESRMGIPLLAALCFYGLLYVHGSLPSVARYPKQRCKDRVNF